MVNKRVLIVEDEENAANAMAEYFRLAGYHADVACNGKEALRKVWDFKPSVVIMDVCLPAMDGIQACSIITKEPDLKGIPVIMLTSLYGYDDIQRCLKAGASVYMNKPVDMERLLFKIQKVTKN